MPIDYDRDGAKERLLLTVRGIMTREELLDVLERQAHEGAWSWGVLYDARRVENVMATDDLCHHLMQVGRLTMAHGPRGPVAIVTADAEVARAGRTYATLGEFAALNVRIFANMAEAERWLDDAQGGSHDVAIVPDR